MPPQSAIAPSVTMMIRHSIASTTTPRVGRTKPGGASVVADPGPRRARQAASSSASRAVAISVSTRGSTPAPPAIATSAAPASPPKLQPACSEDMIGRCRIRSTATPWAFIETSIAPLEAPRIASATGSSHGSGASRGSGSTSAQTVPAMRVARTLPSRTIAWPMIGSATITPIDIVRMISPSVLLEKSKRSWIQGI